MRVRFKSCDSYKVLTCDSFKKVKGIILTGCQNGEKQAGRTAEQCQTWPDDRGGRDGTSPKVE